MPEVLYLIDGYAQIFRAYYAIRTAMRSPFTSEPTNAVFGFTGMLLKLLFKFEPHYVAVAIDAPGRTFRDDLYAQYQTLHPANALLPATWPEITPATPPVQRQEDVEQEDRRPEESTGEATRIEIAPQGRYAQYKGTRQATPDELTMQIDRIFEVITGFGIPIVGQSGLEADDVIATIVQQILDNPAHRDVHIRIVSRDKDMEQLLCDRVSLFDVHTDVLRDVAALNAEKGITPEQVIDVMALAGDTVDNVPGVEGVGIKTAAQLVRQFGGMDGILQNLDQIKGKRRENLEKARDFLPLSKALVTLKRDADLPFALDAARVQSLNLETLLPLFQQLGFNRYQEEARRLSQALAPPPQPDSETDIR